jgi:hypothetical protein
MPKKAKPQPAPKVVKEAPPKEKESDSSVSSDSEPEPELVQRGRRRPVRVARRESDDESSESSSDSLESSGSESDSESGSDFDQEEDAVSREEVSALDAKIVAKYQSQVQEGLVVLAQQKARNEMLARVQSVCSTLQDPLRKQLALVTMRTPSALGYNKVQTYCIALQMLKQRDAVEPADINALVMFYETNMRSHIYKFILDPRPLKTEEQKETMTLLDVVSSDQLDTVDFKKVMLTDLMAVLELNEIWKQTAAPHGTPASKIPVVTKYECAYLAHMLKHPAHEKRMTEIYTMWPQHQTILEGLIESASDISEDDVHSKNRIYGECVGHITKLTTDYQSRFIWDILDMYLENKCSEKISGMKKHQHESLSEYDARIRQFKKEVMSLGWIPDILEVGDLLAKTRERYTTLVRVAQRTLDEHIKAVVRDKPIRQVVSSEEGIRTIPEKTAAEMLKSIMTKKNPKVDRIEDLVFPRPHILKNPTLRELEAYLDKCQTPYQTLPGGSVPVTANKIHALLFLDTIDYMYHCMSHVLKLSMHQSGASYTKDTIKAKWDELNEKYMSQGVIAEIMELLRVEKPEHMVKIKQLAFQEVEMALLPIQPAAVPKKPELFTNGRLRRLTRQEYSAPHYKPIKNPAPVQLTEREEESCRGLLVAHHDRKQPDRRVAHTYHHMPSSTGTLYYQPTLFMKHAICHIPDTHLFRTHIVIEDEKYVLAHIRDGVLVEYDAFDYINLRQLKPLRYDMPFRFLGFDDASSSVSQRYCAERIYALMEKDMPVPAKSAFKRAWLDMLSQKVQHLSIHQVLCFLYMLVAFYHPAFQFATPAMQDTLLKAYSDGSAVKLMRDHTEECTVHCIMRKLFNLTRKPPTKKHGIETLVEYTHSFVDALVSRTFPFLSYEMVSFPYLSSLVTLDDIAQEQKQTLPEELPFGEMVTHSFSDLDRKGFFASSPSEFDDLFDSDLPEDSAEIEPTDASAVAVVAATEPPTDTSSVAAVAVDATQPASALGKKVKKECPHKRGHVCTIDLETGKVKEVCKKCYEKRV